MNAKKFAAVALAAATTLSMSAPAFAGGFTLDDGSRNANTTNPGGSSVTAPGFANFDFGGNTYERSYLVDTFKKGVYWLNLEQDKDTDPVFLPEWSVYNGARALSSDEVDPPLAIVGDVSDNPNRLTNGDLSSILKYYNHVTSGASYTDTYTKKYGWEISEYKVTSPYKFYRDLEKWAIDDQSTLTPAAITTKDGDEEYVDGTTIQGTEYGFYRDVYSVNPIYGKGNVLPSIASTDAHSEDHQKLNLDGAKFGTTGIEITQDIYGKKNAKVATNKKKILVTVPIDENTVGEVIDANVTIPGNDAYTSKDAANTAQAALQKALNDKDPKEAVSDNQGHWTLNMPRTLTVSLDNVTDFHNIDGTTDGYFYADVTVAKSGRGVTGLNTIYKDNVKFTISYDATIPFTDVDEDAWYYQYLVKAVKAGVVAGKTTTEFAPSEAVSRVDFLTFLYRKAGSPTVANDATFEDLGDLSAEQLSAVNWAYDKGVLAGSSAATLSPFAKVSRAQAVTFLWRLNGSDPTGDETAFTDVPHGSWYEKAVNWGVEAGIVHGTTATTFTPNKPTTRAEAVTLMYIK